MESYVIFKYPQNGIQWIKGQGKDRNNVDARAQVGIMSGQAYIFDVSADTKIWEEGQLRAVLECNHVVKVFHDCRNISSVLNAQLDINLCNVFDAQVRSIFSHCALQ